MLYNYRMTEYKTCKVDYAEWGWARPNPNFCAAAKHHETELIRLVEGDGDIYINGERFKMQRNCLYIVRPFILHVIRKTGDVAPVVDFVKADLRLLSVNCADDAKIGEYLHFFNDKNAPSVLCGDNVQNIIDMIFSCDCNREQMQRAVFCMLVQLHGQRRNGRAVSNITDEKQHFAVQTAVEYLSANYSKQIMVSDVASVMDYDEFYAMKLFKRYCGCSVVDYLNGVRVTEARKKLLNPEMNVKDIALSVGYKSASYFNRQFKREFGITPVEYRRQKFDNNDAAMV